MPFDASLLVEEEEPKSSFDPSLLVEEEEEPKAAPVIKPGQLASLWDAPARSSEELAAKSFEAEKTIKKYFPDYSASGKEQFPKGKPIFKIIPELTPAEQESLKQATPEEQRSAGYAQGAAAAVNSLTTPENITLLAATAGFGAVPALGRGLALGFAASMAKQMPELAAALGEEFGKPKEQRDEQKIGQLISQGAVQTGFIAHLGKAGLSPKAVKAGTVEAPIERIPDARQIREAETVDGPLREQAIEVAQEVPAQVSGERVSPPTGQAVQGEVLLAKETPTPKPNARLVLDRPVQEPYGSAKFSVSLQVAGTDFPGGIKEQIKSSLPEALTSKLDEINLFSGEVVPTNKQLSVPGRVQLTFKDKAAAQAAIDYFKGVEEPPASAAPPAPKPSPNEFVPALRRKEGEPIVGKKGQIHQDIYDAQGKMEGQKLRVEQPEHGFMRGNEFVTKEELGNLLGEKGAVDSQRLRELQKSQPQVAPKTAVFNGIQMAGPSFKYFNEKTGRWNDVSAETAKQRGIEIPPEELAKAEAAQKGTSETTQTEDQILPSVEAQPGVGEAGQVRQEAGVGVQVPIRRSDVPEIGSAKSETPVTLSPEPSGQTLGIVPPGSGKLMEIIDKAIGKPKEAGPPIKTETDTPLPDFQEHGVSKKIFSQPFGFENLPVLGALVGGTRRLKGYVNESLSTYWAERQIGRSIASVLGGEYSWLDKPFNIKDGQITNITPKKPGSSLYESDVFEALQVDPSAYKLNPEQQKAFDAVQKLEKDFSRLEEKHKIGKEVDNEAVDTSDLFDADVPKQKGPYFPRIVTSRPGGVTSGLTRGSSVGSKAFFEKPRMFETEAEGWAKGYKYEPSIVNRLATRAERLYKRIADKRLAEDPSLEGVGRKEVEAQLKASFAEELASGEMTEKKIAQMADSIEARGRVYAPAFFNKIFPEETAVQLNKAFPRSQGGLRQAAASVNNALKGLQLGLDLGVGFIQGQALLARHPAIWAKAQFNSLGALFHVEQFPKYVRENLEPVRELAQLGSGVGRLEEYMAGLGGKELLSKVPGVKGFGRQFQTFLDVAKVEMWKAFRETTPKEQWADVAQTLESVLSSGRMEAVGVSQKRAMTERALFLAPSYYRGGLNMIAAMAEKGVSGQIARRAMVAYGTAGAVLFYGVAKQLGMSDDEIKERMNPARSDFMMWRIKTKDRISNVGFGGFYRSLLRLMGNTAKTSLEHPDNWASLSPDKNPITKWYRGHAGPVVTATWDAFSGKDYMGEDVDISTVARRAVTPITVQAARGRPGQPTPGAAEMAGSFVGIQSFPVTSKSELNKLHSEWLANNSDPKVRADYERNRGKPREQSKYAGLITGLLDKDEKIVAGAIKDLQTEGVKRSDIYKRFNPYTVSGEAQKPLFHESAVMESKFKKSLTPEQLKLYDQARQDRKDQWKLFLKVYRENK